MNDIKYFFSGEPWKYFTSYDLALFLLIPALIIFFLVLRKEYLRLDQVRITISGLCLFFSLCIEVVCRGLEGWGPSLGSDTFDLEHKHISFLGACYRSFVYSV